MWMILGSDGQLGQSLQLVLTKSNTAFIACNKGVIDITNQQTVTNFFKEHKPNVVVNCAAWTAVDLAEDFEEESFRVNCLGARNVATASRQVGAVLVHVSTDYVFSGQADEPYDADSPTNPQSVYGSSKLCGEQAIQEEYAEHSYVVRTAWLYSEFKKNFVKTMVMKALRESPVRVVDDQIGQPTLAADLAQHIVDLVTRDVQVGIYHGTNSGATSWYELTREIYIALGVNPNLVTPVPTSEYPTKAVRPKYSVLSHLATSRTGLVPMRDWKVALKEALPVIKENVQIEMMS